jgi:hypothetical protein
MKLETLIIVTKGACLTWIPFGTAISAGLPELGVEALWGVPIKVLTLAFAASVAGAGGLLAFLSQSFGNFMNDRKIGNGNTEIITKP